jgi:hypothetical protein
MYSSTLSENGRLPIAVALGNSSLTGGAASAMDGTAATATAAAARRSTRRCMTPPEMTAVRDGSSLIYAAKRTLTGR